jgi:hypothetical protein
VEKAAALFNDMRFRDVLRVRATTAIEKWKVMFDQIVTRLLDAHARSADGETAHARDLYERIKKNPRPTKLSEVNRVGFRS